MSWRVISIENPARLSLKDNKIVIRQDEETLLPLEDINCLIIDNPQVVVTINLLAALSSFDITTIICDDKHNPSCQLLSYSQHSRQNKISTAQLAMSDTMKRQLWMRNITRKIENQAEVLKYFGYDYLELKDLAENVKTGDKDNIESVAARIYFRYLLEDKTRREPMWYNSALNYGYAIVRSCIARSVASRGLIASQGIFHHSDLNQFNLVDDLIESFRPVADLYILSEVAGQHEVSEVNLSSGERHLILDILNRSVIIKGKKFTVKDATDIVVESLVSVALAEKADLLELPLIISLE